MVELLLRHGADPTHRLKDGSTMLIEAAKGGHTTVVNHLLDWPNSILNAAAAAAAAAANQELSPSTSMVDNIHDVCIMNFIHTCANQFVFIYFIF